VIDAMQTQQQQIAQDFEAGCAELSLLESHVLASACDDPGVLLLPHLILPYLRKRLEGEAAQFCAKIDARSASYSRVSVARPPDTFQYKSQLEKDTNTWYAHLNCMLRV